MVNVNNSYVATVPMDGGVLYSAEVGSYTKPADAIEQLDAAFLANDHGAVGENGIAINRSRSTTKVKMLGGETFREPQTEFDETVKITLLEDDNEVVLRSIYGDANVEVDEVTEDGLHKRIYHTSEQLPIKSWVVNSIDGDKTKRHFIEKGQVTNTAEVTDVHSDVTKHEITITIYKGSNGRHVEELRHDAARRPAGDDGPGGVEVTTTSLPNGKVGTAYNQTLVASGGTGAKTWTVATGSLPAGLALNAATGAVTGNPSAAGTSNVGFKATDTEGASDTQSISITVAA